MGRGVRGDRPSWRVGLVGCERPVIMYERSAGDIVAIVQGEGSGLDRGIR